MGGGELRFFHACRAVRDYWGKIMLENDDDDDDVREKRFPKDNLQ